MVETKQKAGGMFSAVERWIAGRYLRARRQEGFISVIAGFSFLGITLGVATLLVSLSVFNGFQRDLLSRVLGFQGHLVVFSPNGPFVPPGDDLRRLSALPGMVGVMPAIDGQGLLSIRDYAGGVLVKALNAADIARRPAFAGSLKAGSLPAGDGVAIGAKLAERGGIKLGDRITLLSPRIGTEGAPRSRSFPVVGILGLGVSEFDATLVLMDLPAAQGFFELGDHVTTLELMLDDPAKAPGMHPAVSASLSEPLLAQDWQQVNGAFFSVIETQRNVVTLILAMIVIVAAFNIISGMIMMVQDKGREIAILRTMGAGRGMVLRIFLLSGASIGIAGTAAGVALGVLAAHHVEDVRQLVQALTGTDPFNADIYYLSTLPSWTDPVQVALVALSSVALSFVATLYPSWRAARLDPVEALRYE
jgi:lipoprotein-releasing system permease protein